MHRPGTVSRVLAIVAVLSLVLPAIALASDVPATGLAKPSCAPAGPSAAALAIEPAATSGIAPDAWKATSSSSSASGPSSHATPTVDPMEPIFLAYGGGGGGTRECIPGCPRDGKCCDHEPGCCW
jgi:hypothetical protein